LLAVVGTLIGILIGAAASMGVTFIQQRGAGLLDRRTDARRVRDRKFDRLHDLYVDVAASAQLRHETLQGIIEADARIAARKPVRLLPPPYPTTRSYARLGRMRQRGFEK
jgi:hypothetical protein